MEVVKEVDRVKNSDLSVLPIYVSYNPSRRYRIAQVVTVLITVVVSYILIIFAREPLFGYPVLALGVWSILFSEYQIRVVSPRKRQEFCIDAEKATCWYSPRARIMETWTEPLSSYIGIERRKEVRSAGEQGQTITYVLELMHASDDARSIVLCTTATDINLEKIHEEAARTLGVSTLIGHM